MRTHPPTRPLPPDHRRRGAVLVLALLALMLLAAAVFYIFNTGRHLQRRTETQNAADAAAISGANWMARTLNTVAMNNVEICRLIAMVQVLDAVPLAVEYSLADHRAALRGIERQQREIIPSDPWLADGLEAVAEELTRQIGILSQMDIVLNRSGYDIAELTFYQSSRSSGGTRGKLWKAIEDLDAISQTAMAELGNLAQLNAARAAQVNQSDPDGRGFLVPFVPAIPWERGRFEDFKDATINGTIPSAWDDDELRRGPFDTIFGWVRPTIAPSPEAIGYEYDLVEDYPIGGFQRPLEQAAEGPVISYKTYGPYDFYLSQLQDAEVSAFGESVGYGASRSWFADRVAAYADAKMNALDFIGDSQLAFLVDRNWEFDYDAVRSRSGGGIVFRDMVIFLEFSPVRVSASGRPLPGEQPELSDWGFRPDSLPSRYIIQFDLEQLPASQKDKLADHVWRSYRELSRKNPVTGADEPYRQYLYLVWCASSFGTQRSVRNPNPSPGDDDLPAPIDLIHDELPFDDAGVRRQFLRFFAAADQPATAAMWSARFDGDRPAQRVTATASAEVFNNHSWDLWTQMWHAQLVPVGDLEPWLDLMQKTGVATESSEWLDPDEVGQTYRYLRAIEPVLRTIREEGR